VEDGSDDEVHNTDCHKKYYDQHIASYSYQKVWIPDGLYLIRNEEGNVVTDKSNRYYGNSILAKLETLGSLNRYLYIGTSVSEFTVDDEIQRYYSLVGNSDVPYPVAIGNKYIFFMADLVAQPIERYSKLTEEQLSDAYTYFYGHLCVSCVSSKACECPPVESIKLVSKKVCEREY
jgi:hypothetical protein